MSTQSPSKTTQAKLLFAGAASVATLILLNKMATSPPGIKPEPEKTVSTAAAATQSAGPVKKEEPPAFLKDEKSKAAHMNLLLKRTSGNFDKLTPDEQRFVQTLTMGHGRESFAATAQRIKAEQIKREKQAK